MLFEKHAIEMQRLQLLRFDLDYYVMRKQEQEAAPIAGEIADLEHLEGRTVIAFGDGRVDGEYTVTDGKIAIAGEYSDLRIGIPYTALLQTMDFEFSLQSGSTQTQKKALSGFYVKVHQSAYLEGGTREGHMIPLPQTPLQTDAPLGLYTGNLRCDAYSGNQDAVSVTVASTKPYPAHVIGIYPVMKVYQ